MTSFTLKPVGRGPPFRADVIHCDPLIWSRLETDECAGDKLLYI